MTQENMEKNKLRSTHRCTIYDVARHAQVSPSTVSHVLNGTASITKGTRDRILASVEALGYRPNANARALRQLHTKILGVIFSDISCEYYATCITEIIRQARQGGYVVLASDQQYDNVALEANIQALVERRVDGLIFVGGTMDEEYLEIATHAGVPVVVADRYVEGYPCVEFNNYETMRKLVGALFDAGYRRFGYVSEAPSRQQNLQMRYEGFLAGLKERGIPEKDLFVCLEESLNYSGKIPSAYKYFSNFFAHADRNQLPEVIVAVNDMIALGVMNAALQAGLRVPEDIAVVGFDNISLSAFSSPAMTTVEQDPYLLGRKCVEMMMEKIQGNASPNVMLSQQIVVRKSAPIPDNCLSDNGLERVEASLRPS